MPGSPCWDLSTSTLDICANPPILGRMISSSSCLIETYRDSEGKQALARVDPALDGSATQISLINAGDYGSIWLARRKDDVRNDYVLLLSSARWEQDARDDGWELVQKLNQRGPQGG